MVLKTNKKIKSFNKIKIYKIILKFKQNIFLITIKIPFKKKNL